jgi:hypothetical protein
VLGQVGGIVRGEAEEDLVSRVGVDRIAHLAGQLPQVLVRQGEADPQATSLSQSVRDADGQMQEVLTFVQIDRGVETLLLGCAGTGGGGLPQPGQQQRADELAAVLAHDPLRQPHEEDAAVENVTQAEGGGGGAEQGHGHRMRQHEPQPGHQRRGVRGPCARRQHVEPLPEVSQGGHAGAELVQHPGDPWGAPGAVGQQPGKVRQRRTRETR